MASEPMWDTMGALGAGCLSAGLSTLLLQPLDLVKTRLQAAGRPARLGAEVRAVVAEGGLRGLWAGTVPSLWRAVPGVGIYFALFHGLAAGRTLSGPEALAVGGAVRLVAGCVLIPVTVVKTRWEADRGGRRPGLLPALLGLAQGEGRRGLAAGLLPTLLRDVPYSALYLAIYTRLQELLPAREAAVQGDRVLAALAAGLLATTLVQPADVVKTRLQLAGPTVPPQTMVLAARAVWREAGPGGLLAGLGPRIVRKSIMSGLAWTMYEAAVFRGQGS